MSSFIPFLSKFINPATAARALGKIDNRFTRFFTAASSAGYTADRAVSYLRNRFGKPEDEEEETLQRSSSPRPDEMAALKNIKQSRGITKGIGDILQTAVPLTTGIAAGLGVQSREQPQSERPIESLKKEENLGNVRNATQRAGSIQKNMKSVVPIADIESFMRFVSPQLSTALERMILSGKSPEDAALTTMSFPNFRKSIQEIIRGSGMSWPEVVRGIYGDSSQSPQKSNSSEPYSEFQEAMNQLNQIIKSSKKI